MRQGISAFNGTLIGPDDDGYDAHREVWNAIVDRRPALIARCTSAADVAAAIRHAREHDLEIGVKSGGHSVLGLCVPHEGLMVDLTPMDSVKVDPDRRRAVVGGGALLRFLDRAAQEHGLATTAGNVSHTGVGGLTLGGGMGWLARQAGLACDNVEAYTVVTADGETIRATATDHPDLFWGLRGGGGNFGVVTEFEFRLHPVAGHALVVELTFDAANAVEPMRRWRDLLADAPRAATLTADAVTAGGDIVRASAAEHPDLFWALRGGGGNFGVVTEFEFRLHAIGDLPILATFHPLEEAAAVLERGRRAMAEGAPDELLWTSFLRRAPDVPWVPAELVGRRGVMSLIEWSGDEAHGLDLLAGLRDELQPAASDLSVVPFLTIQTITDEIFAHGLRTYIKAGFADDLSDGLIAAVLERAESIESPISQVELLAMGGAIARVPADASAFPYRDARWLLNIPASWHDAADDEREIAWARETYVAVKPYLSDGSYVNFMDEDDAAAGAYGRTLERLQRVKAAYDPDNVFRLNQNIAPASATESLR